MSVAHAITRCKDKTTIVKIKKGNEFISKDLFLDRDIAFKFIDRCRDPEIVQVVRTTDFYDEYVLHAIKESSNNIKYFSEYRSSKELVIKALEVGGDLNLVDEALWLDLDILSSYKQGCIAHSMIRDYWLPTLGNFVFHNNIYLNCDLINCDRDFAMKLLFIDGSFMSCLPDKFVLDEELVILALQTHRIGYLLSQSMLDRYDVMIAAIKIGDGDRYRDFKQYHDNREVILLLMKYNGDYFGKLPPQLWDDEEIVLLAVQSNGSNLYYVSERLRASFSVVFTAINNSHYNAVLKYADQTLADNDEIVFLAIQEAKSNIKYVSPRLRKNRSLALQVVKDNGELLKYLDPSLQDDEEIALLAIINNWRSFEYISPRLKQNKSLILKMLDINIKSFRLIDTDLQTDHDILLTAIEKSNMINKYDSNSEDEMGGNGMGGDVNEGEVRCDW